MSPQLIPPKALLLDVSVDEAGLLCLLPGEVFEYERVALNKRRHWLLGRIAIKVAGLSLFDKNPSQLIITREVSTMQFDPRLWRRVEVQQQYRGAPTFTIDNQPSLFSGFKVALTHAGNMAVATIFDPAVDGLVGVDMEPVRSFRISTVKAFLHDNEYEVYSRQPVDEQAYYLTRCWCLKEAYLKALGVGLATHPARIDTSQLTESGLSKMQHDGEPVSIFWSSVMIEEVVLIYVRIININTNH